MTFLFSNVFGVPDSANVIFRATLQAFTCRPDMTHMTSCRNVIQLKLFLLLSGEFCRLENGRINTVYLRLIIVLYLLMFNTRNYIIFKISASGLFLKFRKFQPRYTFKRYSYIYIQRISSPNPRRT